MSNIRTPLIDAIKKLDPAAPDQTVYEALTSALKEQLEINQTDQEDRTAITHAVLANNVAAVRWLLTEKQHIGQMPTTKRDITGKNALTYAVSYEDLARDSKDEIVLKKRQIIDMLRTYIEQPEIIAIVFSNNLYAIRSIIFHDSKNSYAEFVFERLNSFLQEAVKQKKSTFVTCLMSACLETRNWVYKTDYIKKLHEKNKDLVIAVIKKGHLTVASALVEFGFQTSGALTLLLQQALQQSSMPDEMKLLIKQLRGPCTMQDLRLALQTKDQEIIKGILSLLEITNWQEVVEAGWPSFQTLFNCLEECKKDMAFIDQKNKSLLTYVIMEKKSTVQDKKIMALKLLQQNTQLMLMDMQLALESKETELNALVPDLVEHAKAIKIDKGLLGFGIDIPPLVQIHLWAYPKIIRLLMRSPNNLNLNTQYQKYYPLFHALIFYKNDKIFHERLLEIVDLLVEKTTLHYEELDLAISMNKIDLVQLLVNKFSNGLQLIKGQVKPLFKALEAEDVEILRWLLRQPSCNPIFLTDSGLIEKAINLKNIQAVRNLTYVYSLYCNQDFFNIVREFPSDESQWNRIHYYLRAYYGFMRPNSVWDLNLSQRCHNLLQEDAVYLMNTFMQLKPNEKEWIKSLFTTEVQQKVENRLTSLSITETTKPSAPAPDVKDIMPPSPPVFIPVSTPPSAPEVQMPEQEGKPHVENATAPQQFVNPLSNEQKSIPAVKVNDATPTVISHSMFRQAMLKQFLANKESRKIENYLEIAIDTDFWGEQLSKHMQEICLKKMEHLSFPTEGGSRP